MWYERETVDVISRVLTVYINYKKNYFVVLQHNTNQISRDSPLGTSCYPKGNSWDLSSQQLYGIKS